MSIVLVPQNTNSYSSAICYLLKFGWLKSILNAIMRNLVQPKKNSDSMLSGQDQE